MAEIAEWQTREVELASIYDTPIERTAKTYGLWSIHVEDLGEIFPERRLSHLPSGLRVAGAPAASSSDDDFAELAHRLERLAGVDWSTDDDDTLRPHRSRITGVIRRWRKALAAHHGGVS